jgi:ketosteroid isomerase-like protein
MSRENVEVVRRLFAYFGEYPTIEAFRQAARDGLVSTDGEIDFSAMYPDGPILRGVEAAVDYLGSLPWGGRSIRIEPERFFDVDDERVLVFVHVSAEGEASGVPVGLRNAYEFTIRDGVSLRWKVYADRAEALEAAGLRE